MEAKILHYSQLDPPQWNAFVGNAAEGMVYHLHEYLSALAPDWQCIVVYNGQELVAAMPLALTKKFGVCYGLQPYFSQYWGILFGKSKSSVYNTYEQKKKAIQAIHEALPASAKLLRYNFAPEFDYHLPLQWLGWTKKALATYWLDISRSPDAILSDMASHARREIKKAEKSGIVVREEQHPELVARILRTAKPQVARQVPVFYFDALVKASNQLSTCGKSTCFIAYHDEEPVAGIIYFMYKNKLVYYQGSTLPQYKNSGAMSLIIWESIRRYHGQYSILDFDGSMIESIERFFRGFGAYPVYYYQFELNRLNRV